MPITVLTFVSKPLQNRRISSSFKKWDGATIPLKYEIGKSSLDCTFCQINMLKKSSAILKRTGDKGFLCMNTSRERKKTQLDNRSKELKSEHMPKYLKFTKISSTRNQKLLALLPKTSYSKYQNIYVYLFSLIYYLQSIFDQA